MRISFEDSNGYVYTDDQHQVWWVPDSESPPELLTDKDSLCGAGPFETGPDDPFRDACKWHDYAYIHRCEFEARGWDRKQIDDHFYQLMLIIARGNHDLERRARRFYEYVRIVGWYFYYRH